MPKQRHYDNNPDSANSLADALTHLSDDWLMCRDVRHAWGVIEDFHVHAKHGRVQEIRRVLGCIRCGSERIERYLSGRSGLDKNGQSYRYPDGYQIKGVPRGVKPSSIVQQEQYNRAMDRVATRAKGTGK